MDIFETTTEYTVTAVLDDPHFHIQIRRRDGNLWHLHHVGFGLTADGTDWEPGSGASFDLATALRLAREWAPRVEVNGWTATTWLARDGAS